MDQKSAPGVCRVCGCTEENCFQCISKTGAACVWITPTRDLCSACWQAVPVSAIGLPLVIVDTLEETLGLGTLGALIQAMADKAQEWAGGHLGKPERLKVEAGIEAYEEAHPAVAAAIKAYFTGLKPNTLPTPSDRRCKACGCTDDRKCPNGCTWIAPDLCSNCGKAAEPAELMVKSKRSRRR